MTTIINSSRDFNVYDDIMSTSDSILSKNCRPTWPIWTCTLFNLCGLTSTAIWFVVLFPQLVHNFKRKSLRGLSLHWATANFTASFTNLFFNFSLPEMPLYARISAVYMPILEMSILLQFLYYESDYSTRFKTVYSLACLAVWVTILLLQIFFQAAEYLVWISIVLWSVETIFQIFLNFRLESTAGQATQTVVLATVGKMTDFLSTYGLVMPLQYVVMAYFSCSTAYLNGIQVVYYWRRNRSQRPFHGNDVTLTTGTGRNRIILVLCSLVYLYLSAAIVLFAVGLIWNTATFWSVVGPIGLFIVLTVGFLVIKKLRPAVDLPSQQSSPSRTLVAY